MDIAAPAPTPGTEPQVPPQLEVPPDATDAVADVVRQINELLVGIFGSDPADGDDVSTFREESFRRIDRAMADLEPIPC